MLLVMKARNVIGVFRYIYCHNLTVDVVVKLSVVYFGIIYKFRCHFTRCNIAMENAGNKFSYKSGPSSWKVDER